MLAWYKVTMEFYIHNGDSLGSPERDARATIGAIDEVVGSGSTGDPYLYKPRFVSVEPTSSPYPEDENEESET